MTDSQMATNHPDDIMSQKRMTDQSISPRKDKGGKQVKMVPKDDQTTRRDEAEGAVEEDDRE